MLSGQANALGRVCCACSEGRCCQFDAGAAGGPAPMGGCSRLQPEEHHDVSTHVDACCQDRSIKQDLQLGRAGARKAASRNSCS